MMYKVLIKGQEIEVSQEDLDKIDINYDSEQGIYHILDNGQSFKLEVLSADNQGKTQKILINNWKIETQIMDKLDQQVDSMGLSKMDDNKSNDVFAPMPGLILDIMCKEGDQIHEGDSLLILEAMKMENVIKAEGSGTIAKIHKETGNSVDKGQLIIEID